MDEERAASGWESAVTRASLEIQQVGGAHARPGVLAADTCTSLQPPLLSCDDEGNHNYRVFR